jgi:uncharacterized protein YbaR (Trm112 family)
MTTCPICLENIKSMYTTGCNHEFCHDCLYNPSMNRVETIVDGVKVEGVACPLCRQFVKLDIESGVSAEDIRPRMVVVVSLYYMLFYHAICTISSFGIGVLVGASLEQLINLPWSEPGYVLVSGCSGVSCYWVSTWYIKYNSYINRLFRR